MKRGSITKKLQTSDWDILFPSEEFTIGQTVLRVEPLSLKALSSILRKLSEIATKFSEVAIALEGVNSTDSLKMVEVVRFIIEEAPEILSEMSGLDKDDVQELPLTTALELFNKCVEVNLKSKEDLIKNFKLLGSKLEGIIPKQDQGS